MLHLITVHRIIFNTNWKRKLNTIWCLFPCQERFPFPLVSKGCADFQDSYMRSMEWYFCGAILNLKATEKHFKRRTKLTLCPCQDSTVVQLRYRCLIASFSSFLMCAFKWTHRWSQSSHSAIPITASQRKQSWDKSRVPRTGSHSHGRAGAYWLHAREQPWGGKVQRGASADRLPPW